MGMCVSRSKNLDEEPSVMVNSTSAISNFSSQIIESVGYEREYVEYVPEGMSEIFPKLYLGTKQAAKSIAECPENANFMFTDLLNLSAEPYYLPKNPAIRFTLQPIHDQGSTNLLTVLRECCELFDEVLNNKQDRCILVHCSAGINRGAAVIIGYLMYRQQYTFEKALEEASNRRKGIRLQEVFKEQLIIWETILDETEHDLENLRSRSLVVDVE